MCTRDRDSIYTRYIDIIILSLTSQYSRKRKLSLRAKGSERLMDEPLHSHTSNTILSRIAPRVSAWIFHKFLFAASCLPRDCSSQIIWIALPGDSWTVHELLIYFFPHKKLTNQCNQISNLTFAHNKQDTILCYTTKQYILALQRTKLTPRYRVPIDL